MENLDFVELYKKAWESHDTSILEIIFDSNVIYQEKPDHLIKGLNALKKYWIENSNKQKDVTFTPINTIYHDNNILIEWEASFYHTKKRKVALLQGFMWLNIDNNKICKLKEWFSISFKA
jgi:hypothetical protein